MSLVFVSFKFLFFFLRQYYVEFFFFFFNWQTRLKSPTLFATMSTFQLCYGLYVASLNVGKGSRLGWEQGLDAPGYLETETEWGLQGADKREEEKREIGGG